MKILHTSDWHIGRQLHNVSLLEDQAYVLNQIAETAQQKQVDVVLVAGDIYDRAVPPAAAINLVDEFFDRLCRELSIPVIVIAGNHDSPDRLAFGSRQLSQGKLYICGSLEYSPKPVTLRDKFGKVDFFSFPYTDPATVNDLFNSEYKTHDEATARVMEAFSEQRNKGNRSVILSHCFVAGGHASDSERPLSIGGAEQVAVDHFKSFNYAALGHLHGPQQRSKEHIRYSGSLLKYSFSEVDQNKSITMVDMDEQGECSIELIPLKPLRNLRAIEGYIDDVIAAASKDKNSEDYLQIRLLDSDAILDAMGKLRKVYPNVLHLERPGLMYQQSDSKIDVEKIKNNELGMVEDFYLQISGNRVSKQQKDLLVNLIDDLNSNSSEA